MPGNVSYLFLASIAVMVRDPDLVKQAVQLANNGIDLLGEIARIHADGHGL